MADEAHYANLAPPAVVATNPPAPGSEDYYSSLATQAGVGKPQLDPVQMTGPWRLPAVAGSMVLGATAGLAGAGGDLDELGNQLLPSWMTRDLVTGHPGAGQGTVLPTSSEFTA